MFSIKKIENFSFAIYDAVGMINTEHWNSIVNHGSEFLHLSYLNVLEKEHPDNMHFQYAIIYDANKPIAIAYFQIIDFSTESFSCIFEQKEEKIFCIPSNYFKKHFKSHLKQAANKINMRLLICGNACVSGEHGFTCIPELNNSTLFEALTELIERISRTEKLKGKIAGVLFKDFYIKTEKSTDTLKDFKYHKFLVEPNMILDIRWGNFDEYINCMSKKYRNRAKTIIKKGSDIQRKDFSLADIQKYSEQIQLLYNNVHLKAKFRMATLSVNYFAEMKNGLGDDFNFMAYFYQDEIIGFRTSFVQKKSIEAHFVGLNYDFNKAFELYQNILYDYVKDAIDNKADQLYLGRTASEIKSTIGAVAHPLHCYIRHRNPLSNKIIKPFIEYLKPTEWIQRNPFKEINVL